MDEQESTKTEHVEEEQGKKHTPPKTDEKSDAKVFDDEVKSLECELKEAKDKHLYLLADFENYKKQLNKQLEQAIEYSCETLLKELLNVVDDLERAIAQIKNPEDLKGIKMVYNNLMKILENQNVKRIDCIGKKFNPELHEAVLQAQEKSTKENIVLEELQKGYTYKNKVLRYSKVKSAQ